MYFIILHADDKDCADEDETTTMTMITTKLYTGKLCNGEGQHVHFIVLEVEEEVVVVPVVVAAAVVVVVQR